MGGGNMPTNFNKGIKAITGFDVHARLPLDSRTVVDTLIELGTIISLGRAYDGLIVYVKEEEQNYQLINGQWKIFGVTISNQKYIQMCLNVFEVNIF